MINDRDIDLTDPTDILHHVAEELYEHEMITTIESSGGATFHDRAYGLYPCGPDSADLIKVEANLYAADELGPGTSAGWEVTGNFESGRKPVVAQAAVGDTLNGFVEMVRAALSTS